MILSIKNMSTISCKVVVKLELERLGFHCKAIEQGSAEVAGEICPKNIQKIRIALARSGLELIDNKKDILIDKIKSVIIEMVYHTDDHLKINFSDHLTFKLKLDYTYLANTFSLNQGLTIERFIILHKVRRVKELMIDNKLSLTEISWKMHYSSVAHLCTQFKKITGVTPSHFKHQDHLA
ncbi:AraC family transcriptional regulator [Mucilaginibacter sp. PAMC 26640]|nr:AraC family transcriptional regulator [Mucilaginibacter sp. PAMC 26640]